WSHLYSVSLNGGEPKQLTSGQFEISDVHLSQDKSKFYFTSSEGSPFERHFFSMSVGGGERTRRTGFAGNNQVELSPDETMLADVRSFSNSPPELYLLLNRSLTMKEVADAKPVTNSPIPEFFTYNWIDPPI